MGHNGGVLFPTIWLEDIRIFPKYFHADKDELRAGPDSCGHDLILFLYRFVTIK